LQRRLNLLDGLFESCSHQEDFPDTEVAFREIEDIGALIARLKSIQRVYGR